MHIKTSEQEVANLGFGDYTCNWGTHIAGLYETEKERDEIILNFLHQGDLESDLQLYMPSERSQEEFITVYESKYPACTCHVHDENIFQIKKPKEVYYPNDTFSPIAMERSLTEFYFKNQQQGKRNIRATAEMVWALNDIPGIEHLMVYESRINYFVINKSWISICMYNLNRFSGAVIMNVLQTHPYTISGGVIMKNPYYINPDDWLKDNVPELT